MKYKFEAADKNGHAIVDHLDATSTNEAISQLLSRGLTPIEVKPETEARADAPSSPYGRTTQKDLAQIVREIATMLESGVGLVEAFETLSDRSNTGKSTEAMARVLRALQQGQSFSEALTAAGFDFPSYVYVLINAGEATGEMAQCLTSAADQMEFDEQLRNETKEALIYPSILVSSGLLAIAFIFAFVVPRFSTLLEGRGVDLPFLSQIVLKAGRFTNVYWIQILLGCLFFVVVAVGLLRQPGAVNALRALALKVPVLGHWILSGETARWTSMLSVLLAGRVPILAAVEMAANAGQMPRTKSLLQAVGGEMRAGKSLSDAVKDRKLLNQSALTMLRVGEKSGAVVKMARHIALNSADQHRRMQRRVIALIEPASIIVIGVALGTIMIGVVLAMTSLTEIKF